MSVSLSPVGGAAAQFFDANGVPLAGGKIYTYAAGTTTPQTTYTTVSGNVAHTNPIVLNSAGRVGGSGEIWLSNSLQYKFIVTDSNNVTIATYDNLSGISDITLPINSSQITYTAPFLNSAAYSVQTKLSQVVSVKDFGAVGDGIADDGPACRAAITAVVTAGGGTVYFPAGTYRLVKDPLDTTGNSALILPGSVHLTGAGPGGLNGLAPSAPTASTTLTCGGASMTMIRITGMYNSVSNLTIFNANSYANTSGIRLAPQNESQTTTRSDTSYNNFNELYVNNLDEGIVLRPGPTVGGADSYCYYNTFRSIVYFNCRIGLWLKEPPTQPGSGPNRNTFISMRFGSNYNGNTGIQIDAGDTNKFFACSFEGLQYGTTPNNPPVGIYIAYNTASYGATDNMFFGTIVEACTRGVTNLNDRVEFYGAIISGTSSDVVNVPPHGRIAFFSDPRYGTYVSALGTNRTPTCSGDFYSASSSVVVKASTGTSGQPEFRIDTATAYGLYSYYASGVKQWSMGSQATGSANLTIFDATDNVIGQFVSSANGAFKPLQASSAPAYVKGAIYFDTTLNKLRVGGATDWETVTSV